MRAKNDVMTGIPTSQRNHALAPTIQFQSPDILIDLPHYGKKTHLNIHAEYHLNPEFHVYKNILNA
ncbi:hypothetical protein BCEP27_30964 [Burkholderia cepacia]